LVRELKKIGYMEMRRSINTIANRLGVSRATVYNDVLRNDGK
jgi:predicted transcriptional regulator YheO